MRTWSVRGTAFALCTRSSSLSIKTRTSMGSSLAPAGDGTTVDQPVMHRGDARLGERKVPVCRVEPHLGPGDVRGEPVEVAARHHPVVLAVDEKHGHLDPARV